MEKCLINGNQNSNETKDKFMEVAAHFHPRQEQQNPPRSNAVKFRKKSETITNLSCVQYIKNTLS